jgi:hypothetical protein
MIVTVSQMLAELMDRQRAILDQEAVKHGPSIGDMYEGLTKDILDRAIPPAFKVRIVDGFIEGHGGRLSPQMDAMLVTGDTGRQMPFTQHHVWPLTDVLAVFEIKKTLYAEQLTDGAAKTATVWDMQRELFEEGALDDPDTGASERAFARWAGRLPLKDMSGEDRETYLAFVAHQFCPVRVVFGYQGYANEHGLRAALLDILEAGIGQESTGGPMGLPDLIVCGQNSLLKMNGHPYVVPRSSEYWDFIGSEYERPLRLLFELIWTRLGNRFQTVLPMDDSLEEERIVPLLSAKSIVQGGVRGWYYKASEFSKERLADRSPVEKWQPVELTLDEQTLFMIANHEGGLDTSKPDLVDFANGKGWNLAEMAKSFVDRRLMAWESPTIAVPITDRTGIVITPDGRIWASGNEELLHLWVADYQPDRST